LNHEQVEEGKDMAKDVRPVSASTDRKSTQDIDHPSRAFLEHHPYASGVFTMDPNDKNEYLF